MVKHGMNILKMITTVLNPGQIPVLACDCAVQWKWPEFHGEDKITIMLGGLHTAKALWNSMGDLLASSGWTEALIEALVATSGTVDSFLKAAHITRTRQAHQITCHPSHCCKRKHMMLHASIQMTLLHLMHGVKK